MKRILHVKHTLGYDGATIIEYRIAKLLEGKIVFDWMLTGLPEWTDAVYRKNFEQLGSRIIFDTPYRRPFKNWKWNELVEVWHYFRFFRKHKYEVVYCDTDNPERVKLLLGAKLAGVKRRVLHSHNTQREGGNMPPRRYKFYKWLMNFVLTDSLACSHKAGEWLFSGKMLQKAKLVNNGLDVSKYMFDEELRKKRREMLGVSEDIFVVGHVGRFAEQKNHVKLINVFREIVRLNENSLLILIGDGLLWDTIAKKVDSLGLTKNVKYVKKTNKVHEYYQAMDLFLLTSLFEGLCMTGVEAQTAGLNCIISDDVPKEMDITRTCKFLPLALSDIEWAKVCLASKTESSERTERAAKVTAAGYNIQETAMMIYGLFKK